MNKPSLNTLRRENVKQEQLSFWDVQPTRQDAQSACAFSHAGSMISSQTHCSQETASSAFGAVEIERFLQEDVTGTSDIVKAPEAHADDLFSDSVLESWLEPAGPSASYAACVEMIRCHKLSEKPCSEQQSSLEDGENVDESSRMIVVSWLVEVAEEFGLQQETLHAAVAMLDRFLSTSHGVPRSVLQLVAVGCIFLASKQLEVHHPSVAQLVAIAAHSFSASDLLRVERILLDALDFNITLPTSYGFLHLLTQATMAAANCSNNSTQQLPQGFAADATAAATNRSSLEVVVSLAMYLTELALLDKTCTGFPGSTIATASLLLAHSTLSGHCQSWGVVLQAAETSTEHVAPVIAVLRRLHVTAAAPPSQQVAELLQPVATKFGQECWCKVATAVTPLDMQQQYRQHMVLGSIGLAPGMLPASA